MIINNFILFNNDIETYGAETNFCQQLEILIAKAGFSPCNQWRVRNETTPGVRVYL